MNKVKGRWTKETKGRKKLEFWTFICGVDLHSHGFLNIYCVPVLFSFILGFFPRLSICGSLVCRAGLSHFHTVIRGVTGVHCGLTRCSWRRRSEGVPRLLVKQCHCDWHLERLWKICFLFCFFFFNIFSYFHNNRAPEIHNKLFWIYRW